MNLAQFKEIARQKRKDHRMRINKIKEFAKQHNCDRQDEETYTP